MSSFRLWEQSTEFSSRTDRSIGNSSPSLLPLSNVFRFRAWDIRNAGRWTRIDGRRSWVCLQRVPKISPHSGPGDSGLPFDRRYDPPVFDEKLLIKDKRFVVCGFHNLFGLQADQVTVWTSMAYREHTR